jgi:hypothetical protein
MTNENAALLQKELDDFAKAALPGILSGKEVWSGNRGTDAKSMMATQGLDNKNSITPEKAAHWAYEIAQAMQLKSLAFRKNV